jgi:hypothetical protein
MRRQGSVALLGLLGGVALGALVWSVQVRRHRRNLFSPRPFQRLAALGYLSGQPSLETARLLRDYIKWERRSVLRRRGERVLRRIEAHLH